MHWVVRILMIAFACVATIRCARDRFVFGAIAAALVVPLTAFELLRPESYFFSMGAASACSLGGLVVTLRRESKLPLARTQQRELIWPFMWLTGTTLGGVLLSLLAIGVG